MAKLNVLLLAIAVSVLAGCAILSERPVFALAKDLRVGMDESQVSYAIGKPSYRGKMRGNVIEFDGETFEDWAYVDSEQNSRCLLLDFEDGKLATWKIEETKSGPQP